MWTLKETLKSHSSAMENLPVFPLVASLWVSVRLLTQSLKFNHEWRDLIIHVIKIFTS